MVNSNSETGNSGTVCRLSLLSLYIASMLQSMVGHVDFVIDTSLLLARTGPTAYGNTIEVVLGLE
jgi:hypothetical protein